MFVDGVLVGWDMVGETLGSGTGLLEGEVALGPFVGFLEGLEEGKPQYKIIFQTHCYKTLSKIKRENSD